jgi:regulator of RNase E activity RraA
VTDLEARQARAARLGRFATTVVADALDRMGVAHGIHSIWRGARLCGPARTVWTRSGDNKLVHEALDLAEPGEVLVVNGGGDLTRALAGELMARKSQIRALAGFVIDGAVRDRVDIEALGFPIFARGVTPAGPFKHGPGHLDRPVAIGGVCVPPGDFVLGDDDGLVVVAADEVDAVCERAEQIVAMEDEKRRSYDR